MNLVAMSRVGQSPDMVKRMIAMVPDTGATFNYRGAEMTVEDVKNRLIELVPKTFEFKDFILHGVGGAKNFELLFKGLTSNSFEYSKECYMDAIEKLNKYLQDSSMMSVSPELTQHFQNMGSKHAKSLAIYQLFSELCIGLDRIVLTIAEAKANIIKNIEKEVNLRTYEVTEGVENMLTTKSRLTEFVEKVEELRDCMKEYCQLQGLLASGLSKVPEHYKVSKKRIKKWYSVGREEWVTEYRIVRQSDGEIFFRVSGEYVTWKENAKKRGAIIELTK